ncbi:hypothetical protein LX69_03022 [Breznakibacter xylanolyticus]|uniref:Uncharacterized protein n=1 Tax=Breznakibacter xylanolyticus TaxID=990 RepID=A0A2W7NFK0_9BACT|nr:hypothetical protein LX69_03022 [Breznakibacter xylanolyticus]
MVIHSNNKARFDIHQQWCHFQKRVSQSYPTIHDTGVNYLP